MSKSFIPGPRKHYHMVAGNVVFREKDSEIPISILLNTVITSKDGKIPVALIAKAQQSLQMQFHKKMNDPEIVVLDVVIVNLMGLGTFTEEEFHFRPKGAGVTETGMGIAGHA